MPYITFAWYPTQDANRVFGIVDELRNIADAHNIGSYINAKEEEETEPVVIDEAVPLPPMVAEQLRGLATRADVTIYVHPGDATRLGGEKPAGRGRSGP